ncbi:MAG: lipopolysaccharide biosynthesis protein [Acidobacteriota bacterium]|nr:lipopolysaccharide biosynthesis protein [Acidobacteriota bacterium]
MSVGRKTARAAAWAFISTAGGKAVTLVGLALLARLLAPNEFGLLAFAMAYITYAEAIGDLGSGVALVYWPDRREDASQVTFIINAVGGVAWCLLTLAIAPYVAEFFHAENGAAIVRVLAFSFIIKFLGNTHDALLQKDLRFRARLIPDLALAIVKAIVSLALAWYGWGAWSLVYGHLAGLAARTILVWIASPWRPNLTFPRDLFKPMLAYGRGIIIINVLAAVGHHADIAIVGRYLGTRELGLYQIASKIPETTVVVLLWVLSKVLFPAFAKMHAEGASMRVAYLLSTRYITALTMPTAIGTFVLARPIIQTFFGPAWSSAAPVLAALAIYAGLRCLSTNAGDILKATGRAPLLARLSWLKTGLTVPALLIGAQFNSVAVAASLGCVAGFTTLLTLYVAAREVRLKLTQLAAAFFPGTAAAGSMAALDFVWLRFTSDYAPVVQLAGGVLIGAIVYLVMLALLDRELINGVRRHIGGARAAFGHSA